MSIPIPFHHVLDDSRESRPDLLRPITRARHVLRDVATALGARFATECSDACDVVLSGLSVASLDAAPGDLFVGVPSERSHGARFAHEAREAGAVAILTDPRGVHLAAHAGLPIIVVDDPRAALAPLSAWVYGTNGEMPILFGVTGTNGKTSTTAMVHSLLTQIGVRAGVSTTVERRIGDESVPSRLTTPGAPELHAMIAGIRERGARAAAVEISAHGMSRGRVDGVVFDVVGFTNLSHDHLDEYPDMRRYFDAKAALFTPQHARRAVISVDTAYGRQMHERSRIPAVSISSVPEEQADWMLHVTDERPSYTAFSLRGPDGITIDGTVPLIGRHMAADAGLAIAMVLEAGYDRDLVATSVRSLGVDVRVPGRIERISGARGPLVVLDFSHNGAAFESTLLGLRAIITGSMTMVVGADGDRDASKREHMGRTGATHADPIIITDHHPRHEDPGAIRAALIRGAASVSEGAHIQEIPSPSDAIRAAIAGARAEDTILWAGPGLTDYRVVGADRIPYSPRHDTRRALHEAGWL